MAVWLENEEWASELAEDGMDDDDDDDDKRWDIYGWMVS